MFNKAISIFIVGVAFLFSPGAHSWPWDPRPEFPSVQDCRTHPNPKFGGCPIGATWFVVTPEKSPEPRKNTHFPTQMAQCSDEISTYMLEHQTSLLPRFRNARFNEDELRILRLPSTWVVHENLSTENPTHYLRGAMPANQNSSLVQNFNYRFSQFFSLAYNFQIESGRVVLVGSPCQIFVSNYMQDYLNVSDNPQAPRLYSVFANPPQRTVNPTAPVGPEGSTGSTQK